MKKDMTITAIALLSLYLLSGCVEPPASGPSPRTVESPPMQKVALEELPPDVKLVIAAVLFKARGLDPETDKVTFHPEGQHRFHEETFRYEGFSATAISLTGHASEQVDEDKAETTLEGLILLKDVFDRRAGLYFATKYTATKKSIRIETSHVNPMPPDFPLVEAYLVSKSKFDLTPQGTLNDYLALYAFALENAVDMTVKKGEKKQGTEDEYLILVFCKDRLLDDSVLEMKVTQRSRMRGDNLIEPIYLNDQGFRFMIGAGKFNTTQSNHTFYIGVTYTLNPSDPNAQSVLVGDFSSQKARI